MQSTTYRRIVRTGRRQKRQAKPDGRRRERRRRRGDQYRPKPRIQGGSARRRHRRQHHERCSDRRRQCFTCGKSWPRKAPGSSDASGGPADGSNAAGDISSRPRSSRSTISATAGGRRSSSDTTLGPGGSSRLVRRNGEGCLRWCGPARLRRKAAAAAGREGRG